VEEHRTCERCDESTLHRVNEQWQRCIRCGLLTHVHNYEADGTGVISCIVCRQVRP